MFTGRLTADAQVRTTKADKKVTGFTLAINKRFKTKDGEKKEKTAFIVCSYWLNAGLAPYLKKGALISVTGWLGSEAFTDRDGQIRSNITLSVDNIELHGKVVQNGTATNAGGATAGKQGKTAQQAEDDDLPF